MLLKLDVSDASSVLLAVSGGPDIRVQYRLRLRGNTLFPSSLSAGGSSARAEFIGPEGLAASVEDSFLELRGTLALRRRWTLFKQGPWALNASFSAAIGEAEVFVPAVLYRGNEMGKGAFPKRRTSPAWSFLETRSPLPSCVQLYNAAASFICAAESASEIAFLSSAEGSSEEGRARVSIEMPARERPYAYTGKAATVAASGDGPEGFLFSEEELPVVIERAFYCALADIAGRSSFSAYRDFIAVLPSVSAPGGGVRDRSARGGALASWNEYEARKTAHLLSLIELAPDGTSAYLAMGRRNGALQSIYDYTAGSFLVKSLEGALVLARTSDPGERAAPFLGRLSGLLGVESGPKLLPEAAERIGRFFLKGERRPGVHQDCYDTEREIWGGYLGISEHDAFRYQVNARCNGEVMKSYVLLYEELRRLGRDLPEFIELPKRVARFYLDRQLGGSLSGSFGRWWSVEGEAVDTLGTNGAYVASFLVALEPHFDDASRLAAAIERAGAYYARLAAMGDFFGDTLDADSCDKEAGAALLSLFLDLFERDGKRAWLDRARDAAEFVLSWIWQYDCPFPPESPLGSRRFSTRGMSSVSVAHHHLDFYGMSIAYDFLRYAEHSGDGLYRSQADMMLRACRQLVAGPEDYLGRGAEDVGWQPEQINHTAWDYFDRPDRQAGHFDIDIAWIAVLGLGGLQRVKARYPDALERSGRGMPTR